ncbi:MAG: hypothetical protein KC505_04400 [Myxococcales bacterium]|nr:hypothetical protein [Myxococcales bacterium]USN50602.1 MAG: hypothetical protein H6731_10120 [Myxococcales bacterium]
MLTHTKEIARLRDNASFLAYEYLSWLFLLLDRENAGEIISDITKDVLFKEDIKITLGTKLVTCLFNHKEQKTSITSPCLEESHEIFASLRNGHMVESLAIMIGFSDYSLHVQLNATDFALTQIKLKTDYENDDLNQEESLSEQDKTREAIFLRMSAIKDLEKILDALFSRFLQIRLKTYQQELSHMRQHIDKRLSQVNKNNETPPAPLHQETPLEL